jgi:energy-coupling factor transporter ATP-binding protein EcfA2
MSQEVKDKIYSKEEFDRLMQEEYERNLEVETVIQENKQLRAKVDNVKLKLQTQELERISSLRDKIHNDDITKVKSVKEEMLKSIEDRKKAVLFLNKSVSEHIVIAPGSLVAIASMTNNGKSTFVAHMAEALIETGEVVLILSNEETESDVRARVSCLRTGVSFGDYKANKCNEDDIYKVLDDAQKLVNEQRLIVISSKNEEEAYRVTTVDGVISTLKSVNNKVSCAILDYYNNVNVSDFGSVEPWHVNNKLASELNIIKGSLSFPIVVMAQCEGIKTDKKVEDKGGLDFDSNHPMYRWKGGKNLLIYATDIIELVKDFDNSRSYLFTHKVRFGHGFLRRLHVLPFDKKMQRFLDKMTPEWDATMTAEKTKRETEKRSLDLKLDQIFGDK